MVRHKTELSAFTASYFDRIVANHEFPGYRFKTDNKMAWICEDLGEDFEPKKDDWKLCGYFGALTDAQQMKKRTYSKVKRILLDEAIIDKRLDKHHRYLTNEVEVLANVVDSVTRQRAGDGTSPHVYLLGNACDLLNPYFAAYQVDDVPRPGYSWYKNKLMLLHFVKDDEYAQYKEADTVAGRMLAGTAAGDVAANNTFVLHQDGGFIESKPRKARFGFGVVYKGESFGVWRDSLKYFVTEKIPENAGPVFAMTCEDGSLDRVMARKAESMLVQFSRGYFANAVRFENQIVRERFWNVLHLFGVK